MKKIMLIACLVLSLSNLLSAQNTFPASGNVGIGTTNPLHKLDVRGHMVLTGTSNGFPTIYTGTGTTELSGYLALLNSTSQATAAGLKAGGILCADSYSYANPGKNDLIVKGKVGINISNPTQTLDVEGTTKTTKLRLGNKWLLSGDKDAAESVTTGTWLRLFKADGTNAYHGGFAAGELYSNHSLIVRDSAMIGSTSLKTALDVLGKSILRSQMWVGSGMPQDNVFPDNTQLRVHIGLGNKNIAKFTANDFTGMIINQDYTWVPKLCVSADPATPCPDYVFEEGYKLRTVKELASYIKENKHLPNVQSAKEIEKAGSIDIQKLSYSMLEKIEELSLYIIAQDKKISNLEDKLNELKK